MATYITLFALVCLICGVQTVCGLATSTVAGAPAYHLRLDGNFSNEGSLQSVYADASPLSGDLRSYFAPSSNCVYDWCYKHSTVNLVPSDGMIPAGLTFVNDTSTFNSSRGWTVWFYARTLLTREYQHHESAWLSIADPLSANRIRVMTSEAHSVESLYINDTYGLSGGATNKTTLRLLFANDWHSVVITVKANVTANTSTIHVYVDGVWRTGMNVSYAIPERWKVPGFNADLNGTATKVGSQAFERIDDIRVYPVSLTSSQVSSLHTEIVAEYTAHYNDKGTRYNQTWAAHNYTFDLATVENHGNSTQDEAFLSGSGIFYSSPADCLVNWCISSNSIFGDNMPTLHLTPSYLEATHSSHTIMFWLQYADFVRQDVSRFGIRSYDVTLPILLDESGRVIAHVVVSGDSDGTTTTRSNTFWVEGTEISGAFEEVSGLPGWTHFALVWHEYANETGTPGEFYGGLKLHVYINGQQVGIDTAMYSQSKGVADIELSVVKRIDELVIFDVALSNIEVQRLYNYELQRRDMEIGRQLEAQDTDVKKPVSYAAEFSMVFVTVIILAILVFLSALYYGLKLRNPLKTNKLLL